MPPSNDDLANAISISAGTTSGDNTDATVDTGQSGYGATVWYEWVNTTGQDAAITVDNLIGDAVLATVAGPEADFWTFTGTPTDWTDLNTNGVYGNYIGDALHGPVSQGIGVVNGDTLFISVSNYFWDDTTGGAFSFDASIFLLPPATIPSNDNFANAIRLTTSQTVYADARLATSEVGGNGDGDYFGNGTGTPTVWYYYRNDTSSQTLVSLDNVFILSGFPSRGEVKFWFWPDYSNSPFTLPVTPPTLTLDLMNNYYDSLRSPWANSPYNNLVNPGGYLIMMVAGDDEWDSPGFLQFDFTLVSTPMPLISMKHGSAH